MAAFPKAVIKRVSQKVVCWTDYLWDETALHAQANDQMMAELSRDWGGETQAAQAVAEKAGMSSDQVAAVARSLSAKGGDANVIRMFEAIGSMMGDDVMQGAGRGSTTFGTTPAEARQQLATLSSPGGDYYEATKSAIQRAWRR